MKTRSLRAKITPYLFVAPFLILFAVFLVVPLIYAFEVSLYRETLIGGLRFVGADNFLRVATDDRFWGGVLNTLQYGLFLIPTLLAIALLLALILDSGLPHGAAFFRIVFFIPYAIPGVIAAIIWGYLYGPTFGPISQAADALGVSRPPILSSSWMLFSLANIVIWELMGYKMIIIYAALKAIPADLEEAASLDGAGFIRYAISIKMPLVSGAMVLNAVFSIIGTLQLFNEPSIMKSLSPAVIHDAYTPNLYARFLAFTGQELGYAAAVSFVLAALVAIISCSVILAASVRRRAQ